MALVLLDAGLVGLAISDPRGKDPERDAEGQALRTWLRSSAGGYHRFAIADVTRFEVQRELLRIGAWRKLDRLADLMTYAIPVDVLPEVWDRAAILWALVRQGGRPTASPDALDADVILAGLAATLREDGELPMIATTNVAHLTLLGADARSWRDIPDTA